MSTLLKKVVAGFATTAMVLSMVVAAPAASAASAGEVYKTADGTVWFITSDMQKRPFTSAGAFLSYGFLSFSQVKDADQSVTNLPTGSFIAPQDGKIFCATETKGTDVKGECSLITGGQKAAFTSASVFGGLGFSFSRAYYGDSSFLAKTSNISNTAEAHRPGVLVNNSGTVQMIVNGGLWGVPSLEVFNSWGYSFADVVPANGADKNLNQIGVIPARQAGQLVPTATTVVTPGTVNAALASTNPAASTLVEAQGTARLADFSFTGNGTVTSITLKRIGVSADATLEDVYLFDGETRLTDSATVSSNSTITFAGLNLALNGSRTLSVRADIAGSSSGQTIGVQLANVGLASGSVSGTPVSGNIHTIASATLAAVAVGTPTPSAASTTDAVSDVRVWESQFTVTNRDVVFDRLSLRNIGSIQASDINNFRLLVDGVQVASASGLDSNGYVTFSGFSKTLTGSPYIKVVANIVGGSSRTIQMSLRSSADLGLRDVQYGANVEATGTFAASTGVMTVNAGTMTVVKSSASRSGNVTNGANDQSLATYTFTANGEPVKVESLTVNVDTSDTDADITLRNVRILVNGAQVGSTTSVPAVNAAASGTQFTTNFTVNPGSPATVEVRGDIYDNEGSNNIDAADTITVTLIAGSANAQKLNSLGSLSVPSTAVAGNAVTVVTGSMTLAADPTYAAQTVVVPQGSFKIGDWNLVGSSSEDINVHTFSLDIDEGTGTTFNENDITGLYIKYGSNQTTAIGSAAAADNNWSVSFTLPKNQTMAIEAYATLGSSVTAGDSFQTDLTVTGTTVQSATSVTASSGDVVGQVITAGAGTLTATVDASTPVAQIVYDNQTVTGGVFKFTAANDAYTVTDMTVTLDNATAVSSVNLKVNGATVASKPGAASMSFSGLSIPVAANSTTLVTVELVLGSVGVGAGTSGASVQVDVTAATAVANSTGVSAAATVSAAAGNAMYVYAATPMIERQALPSTTLVNGTVTLAKFAVKSQGGTIAWKELNLEITKTGGAAAAGSGDPTISGVTLWDVDSNSQITAASTLLSSDGDGAGADTTADCTELDTACEVLLTIGTKADDNVEHQVNGTRNYEVRATVGGTLASGDNVITSIAQPSSYAASAIYTTNDNAGTADSVSFTWSDVSAQSHDTGTADWAKDYKVSGLPTLTWVLTK